MSQRIRLQPQPQFRIPKNVDDAVAMAMSSQTMRAVRRGRPVEILPGVVTNPKYAEFLIDLFERLCAQDPNAVESQTQLLSISGFPMEPTFVPHASPAKVTDREAVKNILEMVAYGSQVFFSHSTDTGLAIPRISTFGFPFFVKGDEGLLIKDAYFRYYAENIHFIADSLAAGDVSRLNGPLADLPIYCVMHISGRLQPDGGEAVVKGGKLVSFTPKPRFGFDWIGNYQQADKHISGYPDQVAAMRSRYISAISASSNMLLNAQICRHRQYLYSSYRVFHPTIMQEQLDYFAVQHRVRDRNAEHQWRVRSLDFSQFDSHMTSIFFDAIISGAKRAGKSDAFVSLFRHIHYAPAILKNDHQGGKGIRILGDINGDVDETLDLGNRSGEAPIDCENKIEGYDIVCAVAWMAGLAGDCPSFDEFKHQAWDRWARLLPIQGELCAPIVSAGDDCLIWFSDQRAELAFNKALVRIQDTLKVEFESLEMTQVLGFMVDQSLKALPAISKSLTNFCCPERGIDSPMRAGTWPIGVYSKLEHYAQHPAWFEYRQILDTTTIDHFGTTFLNSAQRSMVNVPNVEIKNAADYTFIDNPDSIFYKILASDLSPGLLEATRLFDNISSDRINLCQL